MSKGNYVFSIISAENGVDKIAMYFEVNDGDIVEIKMQDPEYIKTKLENFGVKSLSELDDFLTKNPEQEVYEYDHTNKKTGKRYHGYSLDKPFPTPSEPKKPIVEGLVKEVVDNGTKVAVIVDLGKDETFTVVRSYAIYDEAHHKMYAVKNKKDKLLEMFGVEDFQVLEGLPITFIRQSAGDNKYYQAEAEEF